MKYQFPYIKHLDDVRPAIADRNEFIIAERDWGYVVNYMVAMADTFPAVEINYCDLGEMGAPVIYPNIDAWYAAIRRECRGLIFDKSGNIIARRLHKFFNVNERDETLSHKIDLSQAHVILEKLDGSMITPFKVDDTIRWGTKMGITDVGMGAEEFVDHNVRYSDFAREVMAEGKTPIFEWCSRQQRIVVDYPVDRLVLIAIRDNFTGEYVSYDVMVNWAHKHMIESVQTYPGTAESMAHLMDETKDAEGIEGWIIRFDDGHMIKVKGEWYLRIHKTKDNLFFEKNIVDLIVNDKIDDAKAFMLNEDRNRVEEFEKRFWHGFDLCVRVTEIQLESIRHHFSGDRKRFALEHADVLHPIIRSVMFACWERENNFRDELLKVIRKNTGTQTKIDSVRFLWGNYKWNYHTIKD